MSNDDMSSPMEVIPKAKGAAAKALQLDEHLAEAHTLLAAIRFYSLQTSGVESEYKRAIALNPGYAQGLHWYGLFLAAQGRKEDSITEIRLARDIDPRSAIINANVGWCYYLGGDYDRAVEAEKETLQLDPSFGIAYGYLGQAYLEKHQYDEAIEAFRRYVSLEPGDMARKAELGNAYGTAGRKKQAEEILAEFQARKKTGYISPYDWAKLYIGIGEKQLTLDYLEKAYEERSGRLANLPQHPQFVSLRNEPRFQDILRKLRRTD
jgi:tetratricopeptide (TPR) repeat protein